MILHYYKFYTSCFLKLLFKLLGVIRQIIAVLKVYINVCPNIKIQGIKIFLIFFVYFSAIFEIIRPNFPSRVILIMAINWLHSFWKYSTRCYNFSGHVIFNPRKLFLVLAVKFFRKCLKFLILFNIATSTSYLVKWLFNFHSNGHYKNVCQPKYSSCYFRKF